MARRRWNEAHLGDAIRLRDAGWSYPKIGRELGFSDEFVRVKLVRAIGGGRIYIPGPRAKEYPREEARRLYEDGVSVKALASKYGIQRKTLTDQLKRMGVRVRNRSDAMFTRMANTSEEDRKRLVRAANESVRGKPMSESNARAVAASRGRRIGVGEKALEQLLRDRGFVVDPQCPVDVYNVDMMVNGTVAVELRSGTQNPLANAKQKRRIEHLIDRGYSVLYVLVYSEKAVIDNAEHLISDINEMSRLPSGSGEHRVVRCHYEVEPAIRSEIHGGFIRGPLTTERPQYTVRSVNALRSR